MRPATRVVLTDYSGHLRLDLKQEHYLSLGIPVQRVQKRLQPSTLFWHCLVRHLWLTYHVMAM